MPISLKYQRRKFGYQCLDILFTTNSFIVLRQEALSLKSASVSEFEPILGQRKLVTILKGNAEIEMEF